MIGSWRGWFMITKGKFGSLDSLAIRPVDGFKVADWFN